MIFEPKPGTYGYLWANCYTMTVYCGPCNRVIQPDLEKMPHEQSYINRRWRCIYCHEIGHGQISPDHSSRDSPAAKACEIERERRKAVLKERYGI